MEYLRIGMVLRPHGVKGAVKLLPLTDDVERFRKLSFVYIERNGIYTKAEVQRSSIQPDAVMLWLSGVENREDAEKLRNHYLCVDREHAVLQLAQKYELTQRKAEELVDECWKRE